MSPTLVRVLQMYLELGQSIHLPTIVSYPMPFIFRCQTDFLSGTCQGGLPEVISVLPEKIQADILLERYFDCVDPVYPMIHR